ncbi:hypothetical protein [Mycobacterium sp. 852002-51961_SCH5331710]|uniref:hypothetical protein n=1 Tax=Mycobacterium sp. 852002-51961_SCH5331710 TaxID=1834105 RepID=UPI0007FD1889|nr:hypothetical protein [Mycobacterium sp. 852002-51961_SCH5331710]OBB44944.1 hypothetical protein A5752_03065 [Mycobacterium sp. 852002-51961_SCH5331710]
MARRDRPADDGGALRRYLLSEAERFREVYGRMDPEFWDELSKSVDQLAAGEPFRLHGWMLPPDHPALADYGLNADLVLTEDDKLARHG